MECQDIKNMLASFLSGEMADSQADEVRQHLIHCDDCQCEMDAYQQTWEMLEQWTDEEPAPGYVSRFWKRAATERSWWEKFHDAFGDLLTMKRLVPAVSVFCALLIIGTLTLRTSQIHQTEAMLTDLTLEEIEFVENLELAENLELLEKLEVLEGMEILDDMSLDMHLSEKQYA